VPRSTAQSPLSRAAVITLSSPAGRGSPALGSVRMTLEARYAAPGVCRAVRCSRSELPPSCTVETPEFPGWARK
jgi:hypothetical protein